MVLIIFRQQIEGKFIGFLSYGVQPNPKNKSEKKKKIDGNDMPKFNSSLPGPNKKKPKHTVLVALKDKWRERSTGITGMNARSQESNTTFKSYLNLQ